MFKSIFPLIFGVIVAGSLSQFPEFAQQYTQRIGGAYAEIHAVADDLRADAARNGKTVAQAIAEYDAAGSSFFKDRGESIAQVIARESYLAAHYAALSNGSGIDQLIAFGRAPDIAIAQATLRIYRPAIPVTPTGGLHAALGFLAGYFLLRFPLMFRRRKRRAPV